MRPLISFSAEDSYAAVEFAAVDITAAQMAEPGARVESGSAMQDPPIVKDHHLSAFQPCGDDVIP